MPRPLQMTAAPWLAGLSACLTGLGALAADSAALPPFSAPATLTAEAQTLIGLSCARFNYLNALQGKTDKALQGFASPADAGFIMADGGTVFILAKSRTRFAALFISAEAGGAPCTIADVVALPADGDMLDCRRDAPDGIRPLSSGLGIAGAGQEPAYAYWEIDIAAGKLRRQPVDSADNQPHLRCRPPEGGE